MRRPESLTVQMAAATQAVASPSARTISGLAVPYGKVGHSAYGDLTFAAGALSWDHEGRVKLLRQHDQNVVLGYAMSLTEKDDGLHAAFHIPAEDNPEGDRALVEAADGRRDGLSVGVLLDEATLTEVMDKWMNDDTTPTAASGQLLEVSQVSLPAFDDARTEGSMAAAAGGHITMAVTFTEPVTSRNRLPSYPVKPNKENDMTDTPVLAPVAQAEVQDIAAPTPPPFGAVFQSVTEAPVYTFDGHGPSFVRDMWHARFDADPDAQERIRRFNTQWTSQEPGQVLTFLSAADQRFLTAAVETRATAPNWIQQGYAPNLLVSAIDKGRPIVARVGTITLTDATPFRVPIEGDFASVADHTEGTAHAPEGDLTIGDATVTPGAISGAYRLSRELVDASNPAIDQIALQAMLRDYRRATEAKAVAALDAADATPTASINTVAELRGQINAYYDATFEDPSAVAASPSFYGTLLGDVDTTGRPMLPSVGPMNAVGTAQAGSTGASIDGVEIYKAYSVAATMAYLYNNADLLIGESAVQTFRFEEVEGPGVIKLALWAYFAAKVTRAGSVVKLTTA